MTTQKPLARCPFCGKTVYVTRGVSRAPFLFFKCNNANCGSIVSVDNMVCNAEPMRALDFFGKKGRSK